ncbi:conserved hypothetical protein [Perkinsus marinus ATCC 50983]|uniref:Heparan-alpha-glucosaminide N-acetyltransferase catalytic domain-containing protein n=1 Tax=Perkinsus marinus (strain ATCC 50983 / TXsc) TaxID=423536 RepID=C5LG86_PERM5|nr:conserved hypothetical protein [Perkinsus marinus ATCC 50983]EER04341.1 conserved hypothetical protein [Perkinsus marinus ATCC 50983]|eukprot:XP_002772525.1 conserved hypothetical protein [Perkinsus marinus ATCC 50983]
MSQALVHRNGTIWREVVIRAAKLSLLAALISALSLWFDPEQWIYFGAVHCICFNSLLTVPFVRRPKTALAGFLFIQTYTMAFGACPIEVPLELPTLDVMPWFHNFGYCLLGVWLYSKGVHKLSSCSIIPNTRVYFEDTVMTTFGRHVSLLFDQMRP